MASFLQGTEIDVRGRMIVCAPYSGLAPHLTTVEESIGKCRFGTVARGARTRAVVSAIVQGRAVRHAGDDAGT